MNNIKRLLVLVLVWTGASYAQIKWEHIVGEPYSIGTTAPLTCTIGDVFFKTNATAGQNLYGCTATNTWTLVSGTVLSVNGVTGTITLGIGSDGTAPNWSGGTLNIPSASTASVTGGLLSKTQYDLFNAKEPAISTGGITQYWRGDKAFANVQISDVTDLVTDLSGKASASHSHNASSDLTSGAVPAERGGLGADASAYTGFVRMTGGVSSASPIVTADLPAVIDFSGKTSTVPAKTGTLAPASCAVGETFFDTDATAGENWLLCTSANTWTAVIGGVGSLTTYSVSSFTASFTSQTSVTLTHNFGSTKQIIACYNGSNVFLEPSSITIGGPSSTVAFTTAQTGSCTVIGGTGLYEESFTSQTSVNLDHDYNTTAIMVRCYDGSEVEVLPSSVTATDADNATVTFANAQTGRCVVTSTLASGGGGGGSGTVISVGVSGITGILSVANSPVTTAGTIALSLDSQTQGKVFAAPPSSTGTPSFQMLVAAHLPSVVAYNDTANSFTAGAKQTMASSATTAGLKVTCAALPSSPATGDVACDSADSNKLKTYNGTAWVASGGAGGGDATLLQTTATLSSWGAITAAGTSGSCVRKNIALTGVVGGDVVTVGPPATIETGLKWDGLAGTDVAIVQLCNNTGASITPADGGTYRVQVVRSAI